MTDWVEISTCLSESRRELVLKGNEELKNRLAKSNGELPLQLYDLTLLNFLEISSLGVMSLHQKIENLQNLTQVYLMKNKLDQIPDEICTITTLKLLDISENAVTSLPNDFGNLVQLHTFNAAHNKLTSLPESVSNLKSLAVLRVSNNQFSKFPPALYNEPVCLRLADFDASNNDIIDISDAVEKMTMLKSFEISNNKITELTQAIGRCIKLKQTDFKGNPLKDKRLKKLIEQKGSQKSILDYIRSKGRKITSTNSGTSKSQTKETRKKLKDHKVKAAAEEMEKDLAKYFIQILKVDDEKEQSKPFRIITSEEVKEVRPYIVGCIIKHLDIDSERQFKCFITLQTKLHEEICQKRTAATIATHDLKFIPTSVVHYDAMEPDALSIRPLGRHVDVTALAFYQKLCKEADDVRKEKKRNQVTGIHKYLNLLQDEEKFAFVRRQSDDSVISLPPLTNSDVTKISRSTTDVFVEVTSSKSLNICKSVMDELLKKMVELGFYSKLPKEPDFYDDSSDEEDMSDVPKRLIVQQVRVENSKGDIRVIYPSRTDLSFESKLIKVERM